MFWKVFWQTFAGIGATKCLESSPGVEEEKFEMGKIESGVSMAQFGKATEVQMFCAFGDCQGPAAWFRSPSWNWKFQFATSCLGKVHSLVDMETWSPGAPLVSFQLVGISYSQISPFLASASSESCSFYKL